MKNLLPFIVLFVTCVMTLPCLAEEHQGLCIDGETYREIKCEHFTHLESIPHNPKLLAQIEKMYPHAPGYVDQKNKDTVIPAKPKIDQTPIILNLTRSEKHYPKQASRVSPQD